VSDSFATWLRRQVESDLAAAKIISDGGFAPERWDTDPPGQVNPVPAAASRGVNAALGLYPAEFPCGMPGWVQVFAYERMNDEPLESASCDGCSYPVALVESGRRQFDHIRRHDPQNAVADCEAKLAILDEYAVARAVADEEQDKPGGVGGSVLGCVKALERAVRHLGYGYRHRPGYRKEWKP
jgi:hypothetical protein